LISFLIQFAACVSTQDRVEHGQEWKPKGIKTVYFCVSADLYPAVDCTDTACFSFTTFTAMFHNYPII